MKNNHLDKIKDIVNNLNQAGKLDFKDTATLYFQLHRELTDEVLSSDEVKCMLLDKPPPNKLPTNIFCYIVTSLPFCERREQPPHYYDFPDSIQNELERYLKKLIKDKILTFESATEFYLRLRDDLMMYPLTEDEAIARLRGTKKRPKIPKYFNRYVGIRLAVKRSHENELFSEYENYYDYENYFPSLPLKLNRNCEALVEFKMIKEKNTPNIYNDLKKIFKVKPS